MKEKKTQTLYILGEMCGKVSIMATGVAIISFATGMVCEFLWDRIERKQFKNKK